MLTEVAVILPLFVTAALLAGWLGEYGLARLKAQEAARLVAWKGEAVKDAKREAARCLPPLKGTRIQEARASASPSSRLGTSKSGDDPLFSGWGGRLLGLSRAEVRLSTGPLPWGGGRRERTAAFEVDLGRPGKGSGMEDWVKRTIGAREAPSIQPPGGGGW